MSQALANVYPTNSIDGTVKIAGTEKANMRGWTVNVSVAHPTANTNTTRGKVIHGKGPITVTGTIRFYGSAIPVMPNVIARLQLYVDNTVFWDINDAIFGNHSNVVDPETGANVAIDISWSFAGKADATNGSIVPPGGSAIDGYTA